MLMKKEQHLPDINTENKVFKRLSCNPSMLPLVSEYVIWRHCFFASKGSSVRDLHFHSWRMIRKQGRTRELMHFISEYWHNSDKHPQTTKFFLIFVLCIFSWINRRDNIHEEWLWLLLYPLFITILQFSGSFRRENTETWSGQYI